MLHKIIPDQTIDHRLGMSSCLSDGYYQYHWWGTKRENELYDYTAVGHFGQYIFVHPDKNLISVHLGDETDTEVNWFLKFMELANMFGK